jgi:serine phosphatase RsbU (regulator of sigma subunit)
MEIKADRMPIGIGLKEKPFTNTEIQLQTDDLLYLFSDGYADQFGGEKGKKFLLGNFKELLLLISDKPMSEQKEILIEILSKWQKNLDQVNDILITGIKIPQINKRHIE